MRKLNDIKILEKQEKKLAKEQEKINKKIAKQELKLAKEQEKLNKKIAKQEEKLKKLYEKSIEKKRKLDKKEIDKKIKNIFKRLKVDEKKFNKQNTINDKELKKINKQITIIDKKVKKNIIIENENYGKSDIQVSFYVKKSNKKKLHTLRRDLNNNKTIIGDDGNYYNFVFTTNTSIQNKLLKKYIIDKHYILTVNKILFRKFKEYVMKNDENIEQMIKKIEQSNEIMMFIINKKEEKINNYVIPKFLEMNLRKDNNNLCVSSKYTSYRANLEASTFKDLIELDHNEYIKKNFRPNSCLYTCIINKFYDRFNRKDKNGFRRNKELTYDFLLNLLKKENKPDDNECSINEMVDKFFKKYNFIGLYVYDSFMKCIFVHRPIDKDCVILRIMIKNGHCYELNNNLKSLEQLVNYEDDERKCLKTNSKYHIMKPKKMIKEVYCFTIDNILESIKNAIKENSLENPIESVKIISQEDLNNVLFHLVESGYYPSINFNLSITKISFQIDEIVFFIIPSSNLQQNGQLVYFNNLTEYEEYEKANNKFYDSIIKKEYISQYHPSVIEFEKYYKIGPLVGSFIESKNKKSIIDKNKAYTESLLNIERIPVFSYFDVYEKYNKEPIEDYTIYLIETKESEETKILFNSKFCLSYGFILKEIETNYEIHYYRKPYKIVDVDFQTPVKELFNNIKIDKDMKKAISNITTGLMERTINKSSLTKIFTDYNEAKSYEIKYNGQLFTIFPSSNKSWEEQMEMGCEDLDEKENENLLKKMYLVKVSESKDMTEGLKQIKQMIYQDQKLKMYKLYKKLTEAKIKVYGIRTDCLYIDCKKSIKLKLKDLNINFGKEIGQLKYEEDKLAPNNLLKFEYNNLLPITDFNSVTTKIFDNEKDTNEINKYLSTIKNVFIQGDYPGVGKTTISKNYDKNGLFICPYNKLCQNLRKDNLESITYNKAFGLYVDDVERSSNIDLSNYNTIVFDEAFLYSPERLLRLADIVINNPDKTFIGTGDGLQRDPVGFSDAKYLTKCLNIIFRNKIYLKDIKRLSDEKDKERWIKLKPDIFSSMSIKDICKKHNLKTITKMSDVKTKINIALFNKRCQNVNTHVRTNILKQKRDYYEGMELIKNGTYFNKFHTNYAYKLKLYTQTKLIFIDEVDKVEIELDIIKINKNGKKYTTHEILEKHFKYPYCMTVDSVQGMSFEENEEITIFDSNTCYVNRKYIWTAITRCRKLDNVYIYLHSDKEVEALDDSKISLYFKDKINGYKHQDKIKNRLYNEKDYITEKWLMNKFDEPDSTICKCCGRQMYLYIDNNEDSFDNVKSNITVDRINSLLPHIKSNCQILCSSCNSSKGNRNNDKF